MKYNVNTLLTISLYFPSLMFKENIHTNEETPAI